MHVIDSGTDSVVEDMDLLFDDGTGDGVRATRAGRYAGDVRPASGVGAPGREFMETTLDPCMVGIVEGRGVGKVDIEVPGRLPL